MIVKYEKTLDNVIMKSVILVWGALAFMPRMQSTKIK